MYQTISISCSDCNSIAIKRRKNADYQSVFCRNAILSTFHLTVQCINIDNALYSLHTEIIL